ncbi:MAG: HAMP domain-containing histidine kinase [Verrucomicrobia bacterium]|nr:HAMP domain-containing histidine kinase [Verrucomicrobiota bacterium]
MKSPRLAVLAVAVGIGVLSASLVAAAFWTRPGAGAPLLLVVVLLLVVGLASALGWWLGDRLMDPWRDFVRQLTDSRQVPGHPLLQLQGQEPFTQAATQEVNALISELAQIREQLNGFSAKVAHELRSPITLLQLQIDYAAAKLDPVLVDGLRTQIKRLIDYVDTALLVARAEQGNIPLSKENCDLPQLVSELLQPYELRAKANRRPLRRVLKLAGKTEIDARIFGLIFNNLMSNAFYHGSGEIRVKLYQRRKVPELLILNRIRQRTGGPASYEAGTGMGLKTACQLARAHGGLTLTTMKRGSRFVAWIRFA